MKRMKLVGGKVVMVEDVPKVSYNIEYKNFYTISDPEPIKVPIRKEFDHGYCPDCGHIFHLEEQKFCERCGYDLRRVRS